MKVETKGLFKSLPNCMTLQEIIEYLDKRNYDERTKQEEHHEIYEEGSIILNNLIQIKCEDKDRAQILYSEFQRPPLLTKDYIIHQPSWLITPDTRSNNVWVRGSVVCNYTKHEEMISDRFLGQFKCEKSIKRTYSGITRCPYTELSTKKIEPAHNP